MFRSIHAALGDGSVAEALAVGGIEALGVGEQLRLDSGARSAR